MSQLQQVQCTLSAVICCDMRRAGCFSSVYDEHRFVLGPDHLIKFSYCYVHIILPQLFLNEEHRVFWGPSSACHAVILSCYLGYEGEWDIYYVRL